MGELALVMAKLSGIRKAVISAMNENVGRNRGSGEVCTRSSFPPDAVEHYFVQAKGHVDTLRKLLPDLYGDFQTLNIEPGLAMSSLGPDAVQPAPFYFSRAQADCLVRDIDQIFEIRANSELLQPAQAVEDRVFITHGRSNDWRAVQAFIEKDVELSTVELAQQPNAGQTIIEKLIENSSRCNSAVIVMTGDDVVNENEARVRENVMHEIGFFQGRYGRNFVVLLHEEGVNIPTNLSGVAYVPFPKGTIEAGFHVLQRELMTIYKLR